MRTSASRDIALDAPKDRPLEARLEELPARGESIAAVALAREEHELSLTEARALIDRLRSGKTVVSGG